MVEIMKSEDRGEQPLTSSPRGSDDVSHQETDVDAKIAEFEKLVDKNDPEQMKMLEEMKRHTAMLHRARGDWNTPNTFRHWNDPAPKNLPKRLPMASETYRCGLTWNTRGGWYCITSVCVFV